MKAAGRKSITEAEQHILNGMDNDVTRAMLSAEKADERKFKHPWSPVIITAKRTVSYWKLWLSEEATKIDLHDHRSKILRAVPSINAPPTIPTKVIQQHLRKAQSRLKSVVQEAANLRARLLEELVEHYNLT